MPSHSYLLVLYDHAVSGVPIRQGQPLWEGRVWRSRGSEDETPTAQLDAFLDAAGWEAGMVHLLLASNKVRFRSLLFPFKSQKRIRQALPFELENVLLEPLETLDFQTRSFSHASGTETRVYMLPREDLLGAQAACRRHRMHLQQVGFTAEALLRSHTPGAPGLLVYLGSDEQFILHHRQGQIDGLKGVQPFRLAPPDADPSERTSEGSAAREEASARSLQETVATFNRFIQSQGAEGKSGVEIQGSLAPLVRWQDGRLTVVEGESGASEGEPPTDILHILASPATLTALQRQGMNFQPKGEMWSSQWRALNAPLVAAAVFLLCTLMLYGFNEWLDIHGQQQALNRSQEQSRRLLAEVISPGTSLEADRIALQKKIEDLEANQQASARFEDYDYNFLQLLQSISEVYRRYPQVSLDSFRYTPKRIILSGNTPSYQEAENLRARLAQIAVLKDWQSTVSHQRLSNAITYRVVINPKRAS